MGEIGALLFFDRLGWLKAAAGERIIGMLGRNVPLRNVVGDLDRDPNTDQYGHKDDQKVSLRVIAEHLNPNNG